MPTPLSRLSWLALILSTLLLCASAAAQDSFSSLEERMTGQEFRNTGLHKLTDEELAALNEWIRARSLTQQEAVELNAQRERRNERANRPSSGETEDQRGLGSGGSDNRPIESRIVGRFDGWSGNTEFRLENGMVWRQAGTGSYSVSSIENPRVTIKPGALGSWSLQVEGFNRQIKVRRVK